MKYIHIHVRVVDLVEILGKDRFPNQEDEKVNAGDLLEWCVVKYPSGNTGNKNSPGRIGEVSLLSFPVQFMQDMLLSTLEGKEYGVEECRGMKHVHSCGCIEITRWAHLDREFGQSVLCPTCNDRMYRTVPFIQNTVSKCSLHAT